MKNVIFLSLFCCTSLFAEEPVVEPSAKSSESLVYRESQIQGWTVRVNERLLPGGDLAEEWGKVSLDLLEANLTRISILLPAKPLAEMRKVPIVLDEHPDLRAAQYHPSKDWLVENGYGADLAKCVHISKASFFAERKHVYQQPNVILHELAHAYHDQVLGFDYEPLVSSYQKAKEGGKYDLVLHISGKEVKHYAMTDHKEYFAEATEAWFGVNDFYPFVKPELMTLDPNVVPVMETIWAVGE